MSSGRKLDIARMTIPQTSTATVFLEQPFHSLRIIPQTLLNTTFRAIRIHHENVRSVAESLRKPLPRLSLKNWLY